MDFQTPLSRFTDWEKLGYYAASEAYKYDNSLPMYNGILNAPIQGGPDLQYLRSLRSNPDLRNNIEVSGTIFRYISELSTDSVAVYFHEGTLVLGFRGTDNIDPVRYMNWVPHEVRGNSQTFTFRDALERITNEELAAHNKPRIVFSNSLHWGSPQFEKQFAARGGRYTRTDVCGIECTACTSTNIGLTKANILEKACALYCTFQKVGGGPPALNVPRDATSRKFFNVYRYNFDKTFAERNTIFQGGLVGRFNSGNCEKNSDCFADYQIRHESGVALADPLGFRNAYANIRNDEKHRQCVLCAFNAYDTLVQSHSIKNIIFSGHSLGGSLSFFAYALALEKLSRVKCFYVGFNAATLKNMNNKAKYLGSYDSDWKSRARNHRNTGDIVSFFYGEHVPMVEYVPIANPSLKLIPDTNSPGYIHGLDTFGTCDSRVGQTANNASQIDTLFTVSVPKSKKRKSKKALGYDRFVDVNWYDLQQQARRSNDILAVPDYSYPAYAYGGKKVKRNVGTRRSRRSRSLESSRRSR